MLGDEAAVVVGGAGFLGRAIVERLLDEHRSVSVVDRCDGRPSDRGRVERRIVADLLTEQVELPVGEVILAAGSSMPRPCRSWMLVVDNAIGAARMARAIAGRRVVLASSIEVYGSARGPLTSASTPKLPVDADTIERWVDRALSRADEPCPPWRVFGLANELLAQDPSGRWHYAIAKLAQEAVVRRSVDPARLTVLRLPNLAGVGQERVIGRLVRAALAERELEVTLDAVRTFVDVRAVADLCGRDLPVGTFNVPGVEVDLRTLVRLVESTTGRNIAVRSVPTPRADTCGALASDGIGELLPAWALADVVTAVTEAAVEAKVPLFDPPIPVVLPPRPERPDVVADRQQACLWSGEVKHGNRWTTVLEEELAQHFGLTNDDSLVVTNSGTSALRLIFDATVGPARPGDRAVVPSFTFAATAESLRQLGYELRFCDVDPDTWTLCPLALERLLEVEPEVKVIVGVDALGNPIDYLEVGKVAQRFGVPFVADSAPALGAQYQGTPVGTQAVAHAFSMSFAKTISAAGAGGVAILPKEPVGSASRNWRRSSLMGELNAIVALDQLRVLGSLVGQRNEIAARYEAFADRSGIYGRQHVRRGDRHARVHWVLQIPSIIGRDRLAAALEDLGVQTKPYYWPVLHDSAWEHAWDASAGHRSNLAVTDAIARSALALPISSEMTTEEGERVVMALERATDRLTPTFDATDATELPRSAAAFAGD